MGIPVSEARIVEAEKQLARALPTSLRQRLMRNNGGEIEVDGEPWRLFSIWDPTDRKTAGRSANHMVGQTTVAREWRGFPADAIAIAEDGSGNYLVLRPGKDDAEIWLHETAELVPVLVQWDI